MLKTDSNPYVSKKTSLLKFISAMPLADMLYHVSKTNTEKTGRCYVVAFTWYLLPLWVCHNGSGLVGLRKWEVYVGDEYRVSGNKENGD